MLGRPVDYGIYDLQLYLVIILLLHSPHKEPGDMLQCSVSIRTHTSVHIHPCCVTRNLQIKMSTE